MRTTRHKVPTTIVSDVLMFAFFCCTYIWFLGFLIHFFSSTGVRKCGPCFLEHRRLIFLACHSPVRIQIRFLMVYPTPNLLLRVRDMTHLRLFLGNWAMLSAVVLHPKLFFICTSNCGYLSHSVNERIKTLFATPRPVCDNGRYEGVIRKKGRSLYTLRCVCLYRCQLSLRFGQILHGFATRTQILV